MASVTVKEALKIETMLQRAKDIEKDVKKVVKLALAPVAKEARRRAPVENPNLVRPEDKHLRNSIQVQTKTEGTIIEGIVKPNYRKGFGGRQSHLTERGYKHASGATVPGKAWWAPAIDLKEQESTKLLEAGVTKLFEKIAK